jgi:hypothetical protein
MFSVKIIFIREGNAGLHSEYIHDQNSYRSRLFVGIRTAIFLVAQAA